MGSSQLDFRGDFPSVAVVSNMMTFIGFGSGCGSFLTCGFIMETEVGSTSLAKLVF